jgi:glycosyltransferase involved in cell wall biosynthesis
MKVDVCIPSLNGVSNEYLENVRKVIPCNHILVETSPCLGVSRQKCIEWVETDFFVFLDDDCFPREGWFKEMLGQMNENVGFVGTVGLAKNLGKVEEYLNKPRGTIKRKLGERGIEICASLCRTEAFKGWKSPFDLYAYEDYVLTQYIIAKGYDWIKVDSEKLFHYCSYAKVKSSGLWAGKNVYRMIPTKTGRLILVLRGFGNILVLLFKVLIRNETELSKYRIKQKFFFTVGVMQSCLVH